MEIPDRDDDEARFGRSNLEDASRIHIVVVAGSFMEAFYFSFENMPMNFVSIALLVEDADDVTQTDRHITTLLLVRILGMKYSVR